ALTSLSTATELANNGRTDSVTVYVNRAAVTRALDVEFTAGANTLVIGGVPAEAEDNSLRVSAKASAQVSILSVDVKATELTKQADPKAKALAEAIEAEMEKAKTLDTRKEARAAQIDFLKTLAQARAKDAQDDLTSRAPVSKPTPQELAALLEMVFEKRVAAENDIALIEKDRRKIYEEINRLQRELAQIQGTGAARTKTVTVAFDAQAAGKGRFEMEYMLAGAWWSPVYVIRGDSEKGVVDITYGARIQQRTGEDWKNVKLTLSTAQPSAGAKAPKVDPWWVGVRELQVSRYQETSQRAGGRMAKAMAPAPAGAPMEMDKLAKDEEQVLEARQSMAAVESSGHVVNFNIATRADVPSGGEVKKVSVAQLTLQAQISYVCSPALSQNVFVRATAPNASEFPMLPGEADVFQADSFVGKAMMETVAPREKLELDLGVDPAFKVERKLIKREAGQEGIISSKKTTRMVYQTEIHSLLKDTQTVEVSDRLPISRDQRLTLDEVSLDPKPEKKDEQNILTWKLQIKPKEKRKIRMEFTLTHPADLVPYGF
ncbi:MAG: mucoidy inhibitor MuiA family protein, partial [Nitrospinota bacterium]|nr:mucoidy inhibitor MuiA family protein [Nitrospinota bacterium]